MKKLAFRLILWSVLFVAIYYFDVRVWEGLWTFSLPTDWWGGAILVLLMATSYMNGFNDATNESN